MSATETTVAENQVNDGFLLANPEDLLVNPDLDIRSGSVDEKEDEEFRASLKKRGQVQPIKVRRVSEGLEIVAGHRRVKNIQVINMGLEEGEAPMQVKYVVDDEMTDEEALGQAWAENMQRKNMTPIEQAKGIGVIRARFGWKGGKNTKNVAAFLDRSPAWVTEREKLLSLPESTQADIQSGKLSADAGLVLPSVKMEKVAEVLAVAEQIQEAEEKKTGKKKKSLQAKNVRQAARVVPGAQDDKDKKPLSRTMILAFFESYMIASGKKGEPGENAIPFAYPVIQEFLNYFMDKFVAGKGTDDTMSKKFEAILLPSCKGEKMEVIQVDDDVPAPVAAKTSKTAKKAEKTAKAVAAMKGNGKKKKPAKK